MTQRGRKSAAAKEIEAVAPEEQDIRLNEPPAELMPEERVVWLSAVQSMPPGWFKAEHRGTLIGLCRHTCYADRLATMIRVAAEPKNLCKLLAAHERETRAANALMRSMRLTHQSRYDEKHAFVGSKNNVTGDRLPWESH
jgi:hypothetical protein